MSEILLSLYPKSELIEKTIVEFGKKTYSEGLVLLDDNTPNLGFWTSDGLGGTSLSTPTISTNTWYNVVFVREGNSITGGYKAYLNGVLYGNDAPCR